MPPVHPSGGFDHEQVTVPAFVAPPALRPSFFAYVVVDVTTTPATPLEVKLTRAEARKTIQWRADADHLRIRRAKITLYAK